MSKSESRVFLLGLALGKGECRIEDISNLPSTQPQRLKIIIFCYEVVNLCTITNLIGLSILYRYPSSQLRN